MHFYVYIKKLLAVHFHLSKWSVIIGLGNELLQTGSYLNPWWHGLQYNVMHSAVSL